MVTISQSPVAIFAGSLRLQYICVYIYIYAKHVSTYDYSTPPPHGATTLVDQGLLIFADLPSHLVGLLWMIYQPQRSDLYLTSHSTHK
jgi:hypothetical protein